MQEGSLEVDGVCVVCGPGLRCPLGGTKEAYLVLCLFLGVFLFLFFLSCFFLCFMVFFHVFSRALMLVLCFSGDF